MHLQHPCQLLLLLLCHCLRLSLVHVLGLFKCEYRKRTEGNENREHTVKEQQPLWLCNSRDYDALWLHV